MYFLFFILLASVAFAAAIDKNACSTCSNSETSKCVLVPPVDGELFCYQGLNEDAKKCFNTDPFVINYSWTCGLCSEHINKDGANYTVYIRNDPIYTNMELWGTSAKVQATNKTLA